MNLKSLRNRRGHSINLCLAEKILFGFLLSFIGTWTFPVVVLLRKYCSKIQISGIAYLYGFLSFPPYYIVINFCPMWWLFYPKDFYDYLADFFILWAVSFSWFTFLLLFGIPALYFWWMPQLYQIVVVKRGIRPDKVMTVLVMINLAFLGLALTLFQCYELNGLF